MSSRVSDRPPLLDPGEHDLTIREFEQMCVRDFPLSQTRKGIMEGFMKILHEINRLGVPCQLIVDGSFLTIEIDPDDVDFTLVVSPEFYDGCTLEQRKFLDWIGDDKTIKESHQCDPYLCVDYKPEHEEYFDGICDKKWWIQFYSESVIYKIKRGVAVLKCP